MVEGRFSRLSGELGLDRLRAAPVILPSPRFFPDPIHGRPEDLTPLVDRACGDLGLDPRRFESRLYSEADRPRLEDEGV